MVYVLFVLLSLTILLVALYFLGALRRRRPNEPPLDTGHLPWLGHVLSFRRDTEQFLQEMQKKHGDIFTVQLAGRYFTFLMDPISYGAVVKAPRSKLDFEKFAVELVARVFGYHAQEDDHKLLEVVSNKFLMGNGLVDLTQAMMMNLQKLMLHQPADGAGEWKQDGLFHYCYNIVFRAGYLALFGTESAKGDQDRADQLDREHSDQLFVQFRKYDRLFPRLAYAVLPPREKLEAERLKRKFWDLLSVQGMRNREQISGWVSERQRQLNEQGVNLEMQSRYMFLLLWASQGNTGPSAFWLLLNLCRCPQAMSAARAEVDQLLAQTGQRATAVGPPVNLTRDILQKTPVLDSAVEESLRLNAAPLLTRAVVQDTELAMADGRRYSLRKGDRVALFPHLSPQMDPEVHPRPHSFQFDRFLNADGTRKTDFYKKGQKVKYYSMPWGAGVSMCPGRFFATNELKQFVFLMLCYFDFELLNPEEKIPPIDTSRWGFGTMQPTYDVQFRYRFRF
ncbi:5-beta-cholestane-3-alpha,7-alpha-diol 12-alpha-hydroxylase-like [Pristis pectinata]|uniref:5-beta-cholestane-3-alpha,7-alpha-diol 12-alpha-hydroxylase-like n=1 Tax=Pristis pectinata TaxID=685728 RepID=UPI00223D5883|nr:5-beta-cholestane-3-alpha,7-alpha-diol 12-alpha-hydroxylase-like [Pristis pectinata]